MITDAAYYASTNPWLSNTFNGFAVQSWADWGRTDGTLPNGGSVSPPGTPATPTWSYDGGLKVATVSWSPVAGAVTYNVDFKQRTCPTCAWSTTWLHVATMRPTTSFKQAQVSGYGYQWKVQASTTTATGALSAASAVHQTP
jgi:hypothetical protein